jgi:hypothetical protein
MSGRQYIVDFLVQKRGYSREYAEGVVDRSLPVLREGLSEDIRSGTEQSVSGAKSSGPSEPPVDPLVEPVTEQCPGTCEFECLLETGHEGSHRCACHGAVTETEDIPEKDEEAETDYGDASASRNEGQEK